MSLGAHDELTDRILGLLEGGGASAYLGEPVSQLEHALQTAALADAARAADALVVAALLHDIGHLLPHDPVTATGPDRDHGHEQLGQQWLTCHFQPAVTEPIRLHVAAKRYLCAVEPGYASSLSAASRASLALQGGPMTDIEADDFSHTPWAGDAAALRRWDDSAKRRGLRVPGLTHYRHRIIQLLGDR